MKPFNGVQVFCATMVRDREVLGEKVTRWMDDAKAQRSGFEIVDVIVTQSSDEAFHCITITIFFNEDKGSTKEKKRG